MMGRESSDRVCAGLAGADADRPLDGRYKNLAIADPARLGGLDDRFDGAVHHVVSQYDLDLHLRQEIDHVLGPAIELGMPLLAAEALGFEDCDTLKPHLLKRLLHLVQLEGLDDRFDLLHAPIDLHCASRIRLAPEWNHNDPPSRADGPSASDGCDRSSAHSIGANAPPCGRGGRTACL